MEKRYFAFQYHRLVMERKNKNVYIMFVSFFLDMAELFSPYYNSPE